MSSLNSSQINSSSRNSISESLESENEIFEIKKEKKFNIEVDVNVYEELMKKLNYYIELFQKLSFPSKKEFKSEGIQVEEIIDNNKEESQKIKDIEKINSTLMVENEVLQNKVESLLIENSQLKGENCKLKSKYSEIEAQLTKEIKQLTLDLNKTNKQYTDLVKKLSKMKEISAKDKIINNEKCLNSILSFLPLDYNLKFISLNHQLHNHFYYQKKSALQENKINSLKKIISQLTTQDIGTKFCIKEEKIQTLLEKYTNDHLIPGENLRYRIIKSILFIENIIRKPLRNIFSKEIPKEIEDNFTTQTLNILSSFITIIKEEAINELNNNDDTTEFGIVQFPKEKIQDLDENDKNILLSFDENERINVKFEFTSAEQIKELLNFFLNAKLSKENYAKFLQNIVEEFSELLFECYSSIIEIKEMEIVNKAIEARFLRFKYLCHDMQEEVTDLSKFAETSKKVKEMLIKQKTNLEVKYNEALIEISKLNKERENNKKTLEEIDKERINSEKEFFEFKNKIVEQFKNIEKKYNITLKERDILRNSLIGFQNYFFKYVDNDGEIIE